MKNIAGLEIHFVRIFVFLEIYPFRLISVPFQSIALISKYEDLDFNMLIYVS